MTYDFEFSAYNEIHLIGGGAANQSLDVRDLYSAWKAWVKTGNGAAAPKAFISVGGDSIDAVAGTSIPAYIYLTNGWRIRPEGVDHDLTVVGGIILVEGGGDPFAETPGITVHVKFQQPVQAITVNTGGGGGLTVEQDALLTSISSRLPAALLDGKMNSAGVDTVITNLANLDSDVAAVQADTDNIQTRLPAALVSGKMDSTLSSDEREAIATALLDLAAGVETGITMREALRIAMAVLAGKSSGWPAGGGSELFRAADDSKVRVTATVDADGNRTAVTLDAT
jgi:hypothetical protein